MGNQLWQLWTDGQIQCAVAQRKFEFRAVCTSEFRIADVNKEVTLHQKATKSVKMSQLGPHLYCEGDPNDTIDSATELFEIDDFTSPSSWEKFVSQLEQIIREWDLHKVSKSRANVIQPNWPWRTRSKTLSFYDFEFGITEYSRCDPNRNEPHLESDEESSQAEQSR